jgi:acetyl esterase/lipase
MVPLALALVMFAQPVPAPLALYDGKPPLAVGSSDEDAPTLTPYLLPKQKANGAAVVICPGGGYGWLAMDHEGKQAAEFLNALGVQAFVLKYRITGKDRPGPLLQAPLLDAQRAMKVVRARAAEWNVDAKRVGVWGFSAGGHLASTLATHFDAASRPDFAVLSYPVVSMADGVTHGGSKKNLLGDKPDAKLVEEFCNEKHVTPQTPPTFLFHTDEDAAVPAENAARFYLALKVAKVPAEVHIYERGVHGVGLGTDPKWTKGNLYTAEWTKHLVAWLGVRGILTPVK